MRFEDLRDALGGAIHVGAHRMWLDTRIGGLRTFVVRRLTEKFEVAVFSPGAHEFDPFRKPMDTITWRLDSDTIPRLDPPFVFVGWHRGVVFAKAVDEPSLEGMITVLWRLVELARMPVRARPRKVMSWSERLRFRARHYRDRWARSAVILFLFVYVMSAIVRC